MARRPRDLYRLPAFGRMEFRALVLRALANYALTGLFVALCTTQYAGWRLGHDPVLGVWLELDVTQKRWSALASVALLAGAALFLIPSRTRRLSTALVLVALPCALLARGPLHVPGALLLWRWQYRNVPDVVTLLQAPVVILLGTLGLGAMVVALYLAARSSGFREKPDTHGSAHWAAEEEVRRAGLLGKTEGLLLGLWPERHRASYLRHDGPEHVFVFAPTRTGKGVGLVVPNLLSWPHSVLVHDIKGENWALSAGWRARSLGSLCLRFDPTDTTGEAARYNPLEEIRLGPHEVRDAQNVADILIDPNGDRSRDHWDRTAHSLLVGLLLHVLYAEPETTLQRCAYLLSKPHQSLEETLEELMVTAHAEDPESGWLDPTTGEPTLTHPVVASTARALLDKSPNERSGVVSTALSFLELYRDPILAANTATSDFRLEDLMQLERPLSLYLTVPSSDLSRTRPLVRMLLNQALRRLTEQLSFEGGRQVRHYQHPLLLMLDEFPALGRLAFFQESLAYLAGYGIRAFLITQDLSQLYGVYGKDESITGNCHVRIAFAPNKPETAELLSRMAGDMTVHMEQRSYRGDRFDLLLNKQYVAQQQVARRLLTPEEATRLPEDEALVFVSGLPVVRARKIRFYEDAVLSTRSQVSLPPRLENVRHL